MTPLHRLGENQRRILRLLWSDGPAGAKELRSRLGGGSAYTTVLSTLQQLEKAGWLEHRSVGRRYLYRPTLSRPEAERRAFHALLADELRGGEAELRAARGAPLIAQVDLRRGRGKD